MVGIILFFEKPSACMKKSVLPTKEERDRCWAARDAYFGCCDRSGIWIEGLSPGPNEVLAILPTDPPLALSSEHPKDSALFACGVFKKAFGEACLKSWTEHFTTERVQQKQKEFLVEKMRREDRERNQSDSFWDRVRAQK